MVEARYFDGRSGRPIPVELHLENAQLHVTGDGVAFAVDRAQVGLAVSRGAAPTRLMLGQGRLCEMPNSAAGSALLAAMGVAPPLAERLEAHRTAILVSLVAFVLLMLATWRWGIPLAADLIVDSMPPNWDGALGVSVLGQLDEEGVFRPSALPTERQRHLLSRFANLKKLPDSPAFSIAYRRLGVPNAFALPGGTIVVADEIVALGDSSDTAMMTVLGHELGHLYYRHGMRQVVRAGLFSLAAAWYFGDISSFAASAGAGVAALHYSREAENAADRYAIELMHLNGLSTRPAADLFRSLERWRPPSLAAGKPEATPADPRAPARPDAAPADAHAPATHKGGDRPADEDDDGPSFAQYLSTHPDIRARIALFEREAP